MSLIIPTRTDSLVVLGIVIAFLTVIAIPVFEMETGTWEFENETVTSKYFDFDQGVYYIRADGLTLDVPKADYQDLEPGDQVVVYRRYYLVDLPEFVSGEAYYYGRL